MPPLQAPQGQQQSPYEPPGPPPLVFDKFQGIKTSTTRPGVPDEAMWWSDGFFPIGPRDLRTLPGLGPVVWTAPGSLTIAFYDFGNIGTTRFAIAVLSDGSVYRVTTNNGNGLLIAAAGTIQNPSRFNVGMAQHGSDCIILVANQANGYFLWDGTTFYFPGDTFTDSEPVPTGLSGTAVEIYAGRVWVENGPVITFSAPGSLTLFASGDGGGNFSSSDSFLRVGFTDLKSSNGFLYLIADSSINYISGVQTSGSPPVTTFTNQNADPEVGTPWPGVAEVFGRNIIFANAFGVHVSYGAAVTKVSDDLDGVYATVPNFGGLLPSSGKATIYGKKVWVLLLPIVDPISGQQTNKLFLWNTKFWFAASQDIELQSIQSQEIDSVLTCWGTDGRSLYRLFNRPSVGFTKIAQSRLWDTPVGIQETKATNRVWGAAQYYQQDGEAIRVNIDNESGTTQTVFEEGPAEVIWENDSAAVTTWTNGLGNVLPWVTSGTSIIVFPPTAVGQQGVMLGFTVATEGSDLALIMLQMAPENVGYRG